MSNPHTSSAAARASVCGASLPAPSPPPQSDNHLLQVFSSLLQSGKYSDLVIKCQGQEWKAHRAVVCSQSRPLAAAVDGNFRESATGEIDLEEDEPEIIGFMLEYFYTGNVSIDATAGSSETPNDPGSTPQCSTAESGSYEKYHPVLGQVYMGPAPSMPFGCSPQVHSVQGGSFCSSSGYALPASNSPPPFGNPGPSLHDAWPLPTSPPVNPQNLVTLAAIYVLAEKFDVQPLKTLVKGKYESIVRTGWNTEHFIDSLKLIYDGTPDLSEPDGLRELAVRAAATHAKELLDRGEFLNLCTERGDITTDVLKASLQQTLASEPGLRSGIETGSPRCRVHSNHAIHPVQASRPFSSQVTKRYKCALCDTFID